MIQIKTLTNTDIAGWCDELVKFFHNNYLACQESEGFIGKLDSEVAAIKAQYSSNKDIFHICTW